MSPDIPNFEEAREICGDDTACMFDFAVTGNSNFAVGTKNVVTLYLSLFLFLLFLFLLLLYYY